MASRLSRAVAVVVSLALPSVSCERPPRHTVAVGRPLGGQAEDGRRAELPPGTRVLGGVRPEVRAFAVHGVIRPSLVFAGSGRLQIEVPAGARALRFSVVARPVERPATVRILDDGRADAKPIFEETFRGLRPWADRVVSLPASARTLALDVETRGDTLAVGELRFESEADATRPDVLVYVVDCLRAGYLGAWGHEGRASPALDALAAGGVRFTRTTACASWTKASTGCLFTSVYPSTHGARTVDDAVDPALTTLAQRFQAAGYATTAFVHNPVLDHQQFGFGRGFDQFVALSLARRGLSVNSFNSDSAHVTRAVLEWYHANPGRRSFVYAHALDLHAPYAPHPPFDRIAPDGRPGAPETPEEKYVRELAYNDRQFGALVAGLRDAGRYDDMMIVVTSDHGEEFGEHGTTRHGMSVYDTVLHVPWIVKLPRARAAGRRVDEPAVNLDIGPTVLELAGLPVPSDVHGVSLAGLVDGGPGPGPREIYAEQISARNAVWAVRAGGVKFVRRLLPEPEDLLFDLRKDPGETRNIVGTGEPAEPALRRSLERFMTASLEGLHVRFGGAAPGTRMTVEIAADAELDVTRLVIRTGDELAVAPDRRSLRLSFTVDEHRARQFVARPARPDATVRISAHAGARPLPATAVVLAGTAAPGAVPFTLRPADLEPLPEVVPAGAFLQVGHVRGQAAATRQPLDPQLQEELRALGYLQ